MLNNTIDSVIKQDYVHWELIIIDDGSTDDTEYLISEYNDSRIKYYYQKNKGKGPSRNNGIKYSKGEYICFLDSDDYYKPNHLSRFVEGIKAFPSYLIYRTGAVIYDDNNQVIFKSKKLTKEEATYQLQFIFKEYFALLDLCITKTVAASIMAPNCHTWQDKHYILNLALHYRIKQIDDYTLIINNHDQRSIKTAILQLEQRLAPIKCMEDLINNNHDFLQHLNPSFLLRSKLDIIYNQIYNLVSIKKHGEAISYLWYGLKTYPSFLHFRKIGGLSLALLKNN